MCVSTVITCCGGMDATAAAATNCSQSIRILFVEACVELCVDEELTEAAEEEDMTLELANGGE